MRGKYDTPRKSNEFMSNTSFVYNKKMGSNRDLKTSNDTYESVCAPEDTEERMKFAQRNSNSSNNHNRLLKRVVSAPVGIVETPKGDSIL